MSSTEVGKSDGRTKPRQFRLGDDVLSALDLIAAHHGLSSRAEAIRHLAKREADRIRRKEKDPLPPS